MRVICTGISGTERVGFLEEVRALAAQAGRDLRIFDVREAMFQIAADVGEPVEEETILDMFPHALVLLRAAALEKISSVCEQADEHPDWIINTHAVFRWKNTLISGFDPYYLTRLKPDLYVTITAGVQTVGQRLRRHARWEDITVSELLVWREEEQWATEEMARIYHKPQYLLGRALPARALYRLMFEPGVKTAYLSYPMQHAEGERRTLADFKARLDQLAVVFDPADVNDFEIEQPGQPSNRSDASALGGVEPTPPARSDGTAELRQVRAELAANGAAGADSPSLAIPAATSAFSERDLRHVADQIVFRDYKLIAQSDMVVVFYDVLVPSPGVISEMNYALQTGKRVYGVWLPASEPSPFFTRYCTRVFRSEDDLFAFFEQHGIAGGGVATPHPPSPSPVSERRGAN